MGRPILPQPPPPTPVHVHVHDTSSLILAISIVGMLTTALLLLSYYIFVTKCRLISWDHHPDIRLLDRKGLKESAIQAIPTLRFRNSWGSSFHDCAVCLNEFQEQEKIRMLPNCYHVFHIDCIDTWLQSHSNCPICRTDITTTIRAAVPIARHPNGESVPIEIRDGDDDGSSDRQETESTEKKKRKKKRLRKVASVGDECIDLREKDTEFGVQQIRRSFSMDSMGDRQLFMAVQGILQRNPHFRAGGGSDDGSSSSGNSLGSFFGLAGVSDEY